MTPEDATRRLAFHATPEPGSFLTMLRRYRGLDEVVLEDLDEALRASADRLSAAPLPRELVSALWTISHLGRALAVDPCSALRRDERMAPAEQARLAAFMAAFDEAILELLEGTPAAEVFGAAAGA